MASLLADLKPSFDYILLDTPPLLAVSDAVVLGPQTDGTILVVWGGRTTHETLRLAREKLDTHKIKCVGVILNNIQMSEYDYHYRGRYYKYYGSTETKS